MNLMQVIQMETGNDVLVARHTERNFNLMSQLIVRENQEAIVFRDGQMTDTYGPGRYSLSSGNIPFLKNLMSIPTGGQTPYVCEVYFINRALSVKSKWGTPELIPVMDQKYKLIVHMGARGDVGLQVTDPRKLLAKLVGTENTLTVGRCLEYFREQIVAIVRECLTAEMAAPEMDFAKLNGNLSDFSETVQKKLEQNSSQVGVSVSSFVVSRVHVNEKDYQVIQDIQKELQQQQLGVQKAEFARQRAILEAQGLAASREIQGFSWQQEQSAAAMNRFASNPGAAQSPAGMMAQMPAAMALGEMMAQSIRQSMSGQPAASTASAAPERKCPQCGQPVSQDAKFCMSCGANLMPAKKKCPGCGTELDAGAKFCPECGTKQGEV